MQLDEIFRLSAGAVEGLVEPFGRAVIEIGDDEAEIAFAGRRAAQALSCAILHDA